MSTLKTSNIQDTSGNNNSTPEQINQGRAKAWVSFDGGTGTTGQNDVTMLDSFNVSSVTDDGTGTYTVNFTANMSNANYAVAGMLANTTTDFASDATSATRGPVGVFLRGTVAPTTSGVSLETRYGSTAGHNGAVADFSHVSVVVFGD